MPGVQNKDDKLVKQLAAFGTVGGAIGGGILAGIVEGYPDKHVFRGKQLFLRKIGLWGVGVGLATGFSSYAVLKSPIAKNPDAGTLIAAGLIGGTPGMCAATVILQSERSSNFRKEPASSDIERPTSEPIAATSEKEVYSLARMKFCGS